MRINHPKFKNKICQACIKAQKAKYGKFDMKCSGITIEADVKFAMKHGNMSEEDARYIYDPVFFFEASFGSPARDYQIPILQCTSRNLVSRQCRQTGKTLAITNKILHYVGTNDNATVLIITPQEKQIKKIWDEYIFRDGIDKNPRLSVKRKREKPFYQVEFDNGSKIMLMIAGPGARGQCLPAGQLVTMHDGSQKAIEEIELEDIVLTFDDKDNTLKPNKVRTLHGNGIKDIYEIVTESGRRTRATGNHPFYINGEWKDADQINKDELIAIPKHVPFGKNKLNDALVKYIGYMIGDGTCSSVESTPFKFTVNNNTIKSEFINICSCLGIKISSIHQDTRRDNLFNIAMSARKTGTAYDVMNSYNLYGKKCDTKSIPEEIMSLNKQQLALFINRLYSTDGWICHSPGQRTINTEIGYCSTSKKLVTQLQYLLNKFQIKSRIQEKEKSLNGRACKRQYILKIRDKKQTLDFIEQIGFIFGKEEKSKEVFDIVNKDSIRSRVYRSDINDIYYEKVKSVNVVSSEETYNLTIENTHTFIVDGIITHNTADWIYLDEAAIIPNDMLKDIVMTIASRGDEATMLLTSTPMGRGNVFYTACKENSVFREFHVSIDDVPSMHNMIPQFKKLLGETGYIQEALAEFPATSGGPFNLNGITLAKTDYEYEHATRSGGMLYFGGVDWNGPGIGTYFYIVGFDPQSYKFKIVDKQIIASANWNSTVAKQALIELNRKWEPKHWMCDYGYSQSLIEEIRLYSMKVNVENGHPDTQLKHIVETVAFGSPMEVEDPFTKEMTKKTARSFIVSQVARLFEPQGTTGKEWVPIQFSSHDEELIKSLEVYKLLSISRTGQEQYGIDSKDGVEDHAMDAFILAIYGVVKYYNELFKKIIYSSVSFNATTLLGAEAEEELEKNVVAGGIILLTDNSPEPIYLDERVIKDPSEAKEIIISRSFSKGMTKRAYTEKNLSGIMRSRRGMIRRNNF